MDKSGTLHARPLVSVVEGVEGVEFVGDEAKNTAMGE